ncbi:DUF6778 family protein [Actibacterium ureilyticum]|uniref:DUF6778 family protein n=1 Tax=Actibacterium ureilyticum TaxID=1590614 RepID=UPI001FE347C6|nr:DUF6778 family protein [Actibacterium ureilyticum]
MLGLRKILVIGVTLGTVLAGCTEFGGTWRTHYSDVIDPAVSRTWRVVDVDVRVPETLTVSEANTYAPRADIVWRGEPRGNRYEQVDRIMTEAATAGVRDLRGSRPVRLVIVMSTFHALTERARYGLDHTGVHNIRFAAQIFDARTGAPLTPTDAIDADLIGYVGDDAIEAEARGETQRVRIVKHVTETIAGWVGSGPDVRGSFNRGGI